MRHPNVQTGQILPLTRTISGGLPDPLALYRRLHKPGASALLESADATTKHGIHSILMTHAAVRATCRGASVHFEACSPSGERVLPVIAARLKGRAELEVGEAVVATFPDLPEGSMRERLRAPSPLDGLRAMAMGWAFVHPPHPLTLPSMGILSFDAYELYENICCTEDESPKEFPDFVFWLPETLVVLDHQHRNLTITSHVFGGEGDEVRASYHDATRRIAEITATCVEMPAASGAPHASALAAAEKVDAEVDIADEAFADIVAQMKQAIAAGEVFQVVPSRTFRAICPEPSVAYERLRALNPSPYMFYVDAPDFTLFGASPETSVKVDHTEDGGRRVSIRPIAGTRARGCWRDGAIDPDLDARMEAELRTDAKELAEHMMLVDLARNDIARVAKPGTRRVGRLLSVERYSHVMHLVSHVSGVLRDDLDALHAIIASMNMGTLTGAPKVRAAQLLRQHEPGRRGPYGGAVGYLTHRGALDTAIIIRSALVRDGVAAVRAGAGVVHDSVPLAEAHETTKKARAVLRALGATI